MQEPLLSTHLRVHSATGSSKDYLQRYEFGRDLEIGHNSFQDDQYYEEEENASRLTPLIQIDLQGNGRTGNVCVQLTKGQAIWLYESLKMHISLIPKSEKISFNQKSG